MAIWVRSFALTEGTIAAVTRIYRICASTVDFHRKRSFRHCREHPLGTLTYPGIWGKFFCPPARPETVLPAKSADSKPTVTQVLSHLWVGGQKGSESHKVTLPPTVVFPSEAGGSQIHKRQVYRHPSFYGQRQLAPRSKEVQEANKRQVHNHVSLFGHIKSAPHWGSESWLTAETCSSPGQSTADPLSTRNKKL